MSELRSKYESTYLAYVKGTDFMSFEEWADEYGYMYKKYAISTTDGHDIEWEYWDSKVEVYERFEHMKSYETDIHLYELTDRNEYEVIDSWWIDDETI